MADASDILTHWISKQWSQAQQSENQRATITNYTITIVALLQSYIVQRQFDRPSLAIALLISVVGGFGTIACAKLYERFRLHTNRVGEMLKKLDAMYPDAQIRALQKTADAEHRARFPRLEKLHVNSLWIGLQVGITILGLVNIVIVLWISPGHRASGSLSVPWW